MSVFPFPSVSGLDTYIHHPSTPCHNTDLPTYIIYNPTQKTKIQLARALPAPMTVTMGTFDRATPSPTPTLIERHPRDQTYTPVNLPPLLIDDDVDNANAVIFEKRSSRRMRTMSLASFKSVPSLRAESRMSGGISLPGSNATSPVNASFTDRPRLKEKDAHKIPVKPYIDNSLPASQVIAGPITGTLASPYPSFIGSARNPFEDYIDTFARPPDAVYDALPGGREAHCDLLAPDALRDWSDNLEVRAAATRPRPRSRSSSISLRSMSMAMAYTPDLTLPVRRHRPSPLGLASSSSVDIVDQEVSAALSKKKSNGGLKRALKATRKSFTDLKALASRQSDADLATASCPFDVQTTVPAVPPIPIAFWKQPNSYCDSTTSFLTMSTSHSQSSNGSVVEYESEPITPTSPTSAYSQLRPAISARSSYNSAYTAYTVSSSEGVRTPASVGHNGGTFTSETLVEALQEVQDQTESQPQVSSSTLDLPSLVGSPSSSHSTGVSTPDLQSHGRYSDSIVLVRAPPPPRPRPRGRSFTSSQLNWSAPLAGAHYSIVAAKQNDTGRKRHPLEPSPIVLPPRAYSHQPRTVRVVNH